jgi:hypothetical protein
MDSESEEEVEVAKPVLAKIKAKTAGAKKSGIETRSRGIKK